MSTNFSMFRCVRDFHKKYEQPIADEPITEYRPGDDDMLEFRSQLHLEELIEFLQSFDSDPYDPLQLVKEACDLIYVGLGTLVALGWQPEVAFKEVHRSNMTKAIVESGGNIKPTKGISYEQADLLAALAREKLREEKIHDRYFKQEENK